MKEVTRTVTIKEYIADDGQKFTFNIESKEKELKKQAKEHSRRYNKYYDWSNFKVKDKLLTKFSKMTWEHFKWEFFRKHLVKNKRVTQSIYGARVSSDNIQDDAIKCKTKEDFLKIIESALYGDSYNFNVSIEMYRLLFATGLADIKEHYKYDTKRDIYQWDIIDKGIYDLNIEMIEFAINELGLEIKEYHMAEAFCNNNMELHFNSNYYETKVENGGKEFSFNNPFKDYKKDPKIKEDNIVKYSLSERKIKLHNYLKDSYKGDWEEISKTLISDYKIFHSLHYFYNFTKENGIKLVLHKNTINNILQFNNFWNGDSKYEDKKYFIQTGCFDAAISRRKTNLPDKDVFKKYYLHSIKHVGSYGQGLKELEKLYNYYNIDDNILYYELLYKYNNDTEKISFDKWERFNEIKKQLKSNNKYKSDGNCHWNDRKGFDYVIKVDNHTKKSDLIGYEYISTWYEKVKILDAIKYETNKPGKYFHLKTEKSKLTYDEFLEYVNQISDKKYKEKIKKEIEELEKKKKSLMEKIK